MSSTDNGQNRRTKPSPDEFAKHYTSGDTKGNQFASMIAAGYSPNTAKRGKAALSGDMIRALAEQGVKFAEIGKSLDMQHVEHSIAGRLYTNMLSGNSKGNEAAKLLGSMNKFSSFRSEQNTNLIVLTDVTRGAMAPDAELEAPVRQLEPSDV